MKRAHRRRPTTDFYSKAGTGHCFASAFRTAAGFGQALSSAKDKAAVQASRRIHDEVSSSIPSEGFDNVVEMVFDVPLSNSEKPREPARRQQRSGDRLNDALPNRALSSFLAHLLCTLRSVLVCRGLRPCSCCTFCMPHSPCPLPILSLYRIPIAYPKTITIARGDTYRMRTCQIR